MNMVVWIATLLVQVKVDTRVDHGREGGREGGRTGGRKAGTLAGNLNFEIKIKLRMLGMNSVSTIIQLAAPALRNKRSKGMHRHALG